MVSQRLIFHLTSFDKVREVLANDQGWDPNNLFPVYIEEGKKVVHHKNQLFDALGKAPLYNELSPWRVEFL